MPFDWDINRLEKDQNIQVHNEIQIPSKWFSEDEDSIVAYDTGSINSKNNTAVNQAIGEVNDERLEGRSFVTDPFSSLDSATFHYILDKNYLMNLEQNHSTNRSNDNTDDDGYIKFVLQGF